MMAKFKTVSTLIVDCSDWGFGPFEILAVPGEDNLYDFYLRHPNYGVVMDMFSSCWDNPEGGS